MLVSLLIVPLIGSLLYLPATSGSWIIEWLNSKELHSKFQDQGDFLGNLTLKELDLANSNTFISSPLENDYNSFVSSAIYLLEKNLSLSLILVYLILFIIYIFTVRVIMENHANFNFILKFPFGKTLQIFLKKVFTFSQSIGNLWFYFMFFCLFVSSLCSAYCIHICILILKMIPS
uniref:hypothetical protein n=1 Tax=Daedalea confragosa TaxID=2028083 RepID=UPI002A8141D2|nr:hypothetical protein UYH48_mgp17 [Daedaleopsis confragosa]WNZ34405.1 hypothetical protein [Daedaleopsis confragosa]